MPDLNQLVAFSVPSGCVCSKRIHPQNVRPWIIAEFLLKRSWFCSITRGILAHEKALKSQTGQCLFGIYSVLFRKCIFPADLFFPNRIEYVFIFSYLLILFTCNYSLVLNTYILKNRYIFLWLLFIIATDCSSSWAFYSWMCMMLNHLHLHI